jgi:hypothetical protein
VGPSQLIHLKGKDPLRSTLAAVIAQSRISREDFSAMRTIQILPASIVVACFAVAGVAQAQSAAPASPSGAASMPHECAQPMAKHSHAAEKGSPVKASKSGPCASVASVSTKNDKKKHNHARDAK